MPRLPRLHAPGAVYHVTARGNHRNDIFFKHADRQLLDDIMAHALELTGARIHPTVDDESSAPAGAGRGTSTEAHLRCPEQSSDMPMMRRDEILQSCKPDTEGSTR